MPLLGGVRPPIAAFVVLLLAIASVMAFTAGRAGDSAVPQALRDGERAIAADAAAAVRGTVTTQALSVRRTADAYRPTDSSEPATVLTALSAGLTGDDGAELLDARTGAELAQDGSAVPLFGVDVLAQERSSDGSDGIAPRLVGTTPATARLLYFARMTLPAPGADQDQDQAQDNSGQQRRRWLLVVSAPLSVPSVHGADRVVRLVDADGHLLGTNAAERPVATTGSAAAQAAATSHPLAPADHALPVAAANAANAVPQGEDAAGALLSATTPGSATRTLAGWASVAQADGGRAYSDLGLVVLTTRQVSPDAQAGDHTAATLYAAAALAGLTLLCGLLLLLTVQRPLLRLHLSAARLSRAAQDGTAGEDLTRPVPVARFGEPARTGAALESLRRQLLGEGPRHPAPAPRRAGVRAVVVLCVVLVAAWAVPLLLFVNHTTGTGAVPRDVVADQQARTQTAADRVRASLDQRGLELTALAAQMTGRSAHDDGALLRSALDEHPQYRSLYVVDRAGRVLARVGGVPVRAGGAVPTGSGITRLNQSGRIPAVAAYVPVPARQASAPVAAPAGAEVTTKPIVQPVTAQGVPAVVYGEIDVHSLDDALSRPGLSRLWLVDDRQRMIAASVGFRAFQALPDAGLTRLAVATQTGAGTLGQPRSAVLVHGSAPVGDSSVAAAVPLAATGPAASLGWQVVSSQPAETLSLAPYQAQSQAILAGLLALALGAATLGWLHVVVVRPLRALARLADRLADGDRRTVLYPVNFDEAGSVTRGLEVLRQALAARRTAPAVPAASFAPFEPAHHFPGQGGNPPGAERN